MLYAEKFMKRASRLSLGAITDGVVIVTCTAMVLGLFFSQAVRALDRNQRLQALYDHLQEQSPLHDAFIARYRLCAPVLTDFRKVESGLDCLGQTVKEMRGLDVSDGHLFRVEQDVREGEQTIMAQYPSTFLR